MTADEGADVRIRAPGRRWTWFFAQGWFLLALSLVSWLTQGGHWFNVPWLVLSCGNIAILFLLRTFGVDLTPESAVVRGWRRRSVPWRAVQAVVSHKTSKGTSVVRLILEKNALVTLPASTSLGRKDDAHYERDFNRIYQWWLTHRGESWNPSSPETTPAPFHG